MHASTAIPIEGALDGRDLIAPSLGDRPWGALDLDHLDTAF